MATIGTSYREGKAMRMHIAAIDKKLRHDVERDRKEALLELERRSQDNSQRLVGRTTETIHVPRSAPIFVGVDHPTEGRNG